MGEEGGERGGGGGKGAYRLFVGNITALLDRILTLLLLCMGTASIENPIVCFVSTSGSGAFVARVQRRVAVGVSCK